MATRVAMIHPQTGLKKSAFIGFSWTYLFFGFFVPLFRGELIVALIHFIFCLLTAGLWQLIAAFIYNRQYSHRLIEQGYLLSDTKRKNQWAADKLGIELASIELSPVELSSAAHLKKNKRTDRHSTLIE